MALARTLGFRRRRVVGASYTPSLSCINIVESLIVEERMNFDQEFPAI